jgi:hypothetical protein
MMWFVKIKKPLYYNTDRFSKRDTGFACIGRFSGERGREQAGVLAWRGTQNEHTPGIPGIPGILGISGEELAVYSGSRLMNEDLES